MFSDTAQYFHSKHLKNRPKRHEKHFFSTEWCFRAKQIFSKIDCELLLYANLTKFIGLLDQKRLVFLHQNLFPTSFD